MIFKSLAASLVLLAAMTTTAAATPVLWTLDYAIEFQNDPFIQPDITFAGTFVYDADTGVASDILINNSLGETFDTDITGIPTFGVDPSALLFATDTPQVGGGSVIFIQLGLTGGAPLPNAGGSFAVDGLAAVDDFFLTHMICGSVNALCDGIGFTDIDLAASNIVGTLTGRPIAVPAPGAALLFVTGLLGLGAVARRRRKSGDEKSGQPASAHR